MKSLLFRRAVRANIFALAIAIPAALHAQSLIDTASLTLPDAPSSQGDLSLVNNDAVFSSSQQTPTAQVPAAGQPGTPSPADQEPLTAEEKKAAAEAEAQRELHQRMAGVIPNFNAVLNGGSQVPLTPKQKMRAAFRSSVDPYQFGLAAFTSAIGQATDSHSSYDPVRMINVGYSQGWVGYGQRFGASFADQFDGTIIGNGILPVVLHQDSRYYRKGSGSVSSRALYAAFSAIRCKSDKGNWQPNYSNVLGNLAAGGISNLYYPAADRGFGLTMKQGFIVTAEGIVGSMLIEFYPDVIKRVHHSKPPADAPSNVAASASSN